MVNLSVTLSLIFFFMLFVWFCCCCCSYPVHCFWLSVLRAYNAAYFCCGCCCWLVGWLVLPHHLLDAPIWIRFQCWICVCVLFTGFFFFAFFCVFNCWCCSCWCWYPPLWLASRWSTGIAKGRFVERVLEKL